MRRRKKRMVMVMRMKMSDGQHDYSNRIEYYGVHILILFLCMHNLGCLLYVLDSCPGLPVEREGSANSKTKTSRGAVKPVCVQMESY